MSSSPANNASDAWKRACFPSNDFFEEFGVGESCFMYHDLSDGRDDVKNADTFTPPQRRPQSPNLGKSGDDVVNPLKALQSLNISAENFVRKQREEEVPLEPFVSNPFLLSVCQLRSLLKQLSDKKE